jgi:hypothetical protein
MYLLASGQEARQKILMCYQYISFPGMAGHVSVMVVAKIMGGFVIVSIVRRILDLLPT